jgi:hypothetical protein
MTPNLPKPRPNVLPALVFVLGFRLLTLFYALARFGGHFAEDDAARTTGPVAAVFQTGLIAPLDKYIYANGFLYQVFGSVLAQITGLSVLEMQRWLAPFLNLALTLVAFAFYMRLFNRPALAALATIFVQIQGDFMYTTLRSSHEKMDYMLIFVALLVLTLSVQWFDSLRERVVLALIYYLLILAESTNNVFFASTFTVTLVLSFLFWYGLKRYANRRLLGLGWISGAAIFATLVTILLKGFLFVTPPVGPGVSVWPVLAKWAIIFFAIFSLTLLAIFLLQGGQRGKNSLANESVWLLFIAIISMAFIFIVIFFLYPPAQNVVAVAGDLSERIRLFMVSPVSETSGLIETVTTSWVFPNAWLWLRLYDIFILLCAGLGWIYMVFHLRSATNSDFSPSGAGAFWILVLLPAFSVQNLLFIISDLTGAAGQINNLQIRLIPFTALIAVPAAVYALVIFFRWLRARRIVYRLAFGGAVLATLLALVAGLIKGVSEPLLSNNWTFYTPAESAGAVWLDSTMPQFDFELGRRTPLIWGGTDFRIGRIWREQLWGARRGILPFAATLDASYAYIFLSPTIRLQTERYGEPIPDLRGTGLIYDNGDLQIYYRPPELRK